MKKDEEQSILLYIPIGINTRMDYFTGFGKKELSQAMVGIVIGVLLAILSYILTNQALPVVVIMIFAIGGSVLMTTKNSLNISAIDYINNAIKFSNERKTYQYKQAK